GVEEVAAQVAKAASSVASLDIRYNVVSRIAIDRELTFGAAENDLRGVSAARGAEDVDGELLGQERPHERARHARLHTHARLIGLHMGVDPHLVTGAPP